MSYEYDDRGPFQVASDAVDTIIGLMIDAVDRDDYIPMDEFEKSHYQGLFDLADELVDTLEHYRKHIGLDIEVELE